MVINTVAEAGAVVVVVDHFGEELAVGEYAVAVCDDWHFDLF